VNYEEVIKGESPTEWPPMKKEVDLEARVERGRKTQVKTETSESGGLNIILIFYHFVSIKMTCQSAGPQPKTLMGEFIIGTKRPKPLNGTNQRLSYYFTASNEMAL